MTRCTCKAPSAASAAARIAATAAPPAWRRPRTSCTCWRAWASRPASISDKLIDCVWMMEKMIGRYAWGHVSRCGPRPMKREQFFDANAPFVETVEQAQALHAAASSLRGLHLSVGQADQQPVSRSRAAGPADLRAGRRLAVGGSVLPEADGAREVVGTGPPAPGRGRTVAVAGRGSDAPARVPSRTGCVHDPSVLTRSFA